MSVTKSTNLTPGQQYTLTVTLGSCGSDYAKGVKAFIDWNIDGDFDDSGEEIAVSSIMGNGDFTANVTVPTSVKAGTTRLRIVLREKTSNDADDATALANIKSCGPYEWGETEDYSVVTLSSVTGVGNELFANSVSVSPNPTSSNAEVSMDNFQMGQVSFTLMNVTGKLLKNWEVNKTTQQLNVPVSLSNLPKGVYLIQVKMNGAQTVKRILKN